MKQVHFHQLDLNLLRVLDRIYVEGSITRAAATLNVSQSAVSHALARLRTVFGDPLFSREGAGVAASPLMKSLAGPLHTALAGLEEVVSEGAGFDLKKSARRFTVGMDERLEIFALPFLTESLLKQAPNIELRSVRFQSEDLESELASGRMDVAVRAGTLISPNIVSQKVASDSLIVMGRAGHPLLKGGKISIKAYSDAEHVSVGGAADTFSAEDLALHHAGLHRRVTVRTQRYFAAVNIVSRTDLLVTMPLLYGDVLNQLPKNTIVRLPKDIATIDYFIHWHTSSANERGNIWLREAVIESFASQDYERLFWK